MKCKYCQADCIKKGIYKKTQKYQCKSCGKYQRALYKQRKHNHEVEGQIRTLNNEGVGVCSMARILMIPKSSVQMLLKRASLKVNKPIYKDNGETYEMDELYTFIGCKAKPCYIMYAINQRTRQVVDFVIGARTKENIGKVVHSLLQLSPNKIYTDSLPIFKYLIPGKLHRSFRYRTNRIERKNLTLRMHLKRLGRKTICYSKSKAMLENCFRLYVWQ